MGNIFYTTNPWLADLVSDEAFVSALKTVQNEMHEFDSEDSPRATIPSDPRNILPIKIRFCDMVRNCSLPE